MKAVAAKRRALLILILVCVGPFGALALPARPGPIDGFEAYIEAKSLIYGGVGESDRAEVLVESAIRDFRRERNAALSSYWLARGYLLKALYENRLGNSRAAQAEVRRVFEELETAMGDGEFSDGLRLFADAHFQMAQARGFVYMLRNGDDAVEATLRALELGPDNILAHITGAGYYLNAPPFAGGDVERARELLERALTLEAESDNDLFLIHAWLAVAYSRSGRETKALVHWNAATDIHPTSEVLERVGEEIGLTTSR